MKNMIISLAVLFIAVGCTEEKQTKNLLITGNIKGLKKGTLYIQQLQDSTFAVLDSIVINGNSEFKSEIDLKSPEMLYLFVDRGVSNNIDNNLPFFAEPGKINIDTNLERFFADAKITGSKNHDLYVEYKKVNSRYNNQQLDLTVSKLQLKTPQDEAGALALQKQEDAITKRKYLYAINFAINHKDYDVAPFIAMSEISNANIKYLDTIMHVLPKKIAEAKYGTQLSKYIAVRKAEEARQ